MRGRGKNRWLAIAARERIPHAGRTGATKAGAPYGSGVN